MVIVCMTFFKKTTFRDVLVHIIFEWKLESSYVPILDCF